MLKRESRLGDSSRWSRPIWEEAQFIAFSFPGLIKIGIQRWMPAVECSLLKLAETEYERTAPSGELTLL
jgi:hypothetical protein